VGGKVISDCLGEFAERAVDKQTVRQIQTIIESDRKILNWHQLRTRRVGREIFLDLHILVNPELSIAEAHEISEGLEQALRDQLTQPVNVIVHIEPDLPHLRRERKTADG
ncbi:MAG TPA: cation transporter dimerization domain-containing protein, partial [Anaerohalosphaeraceae bacterium]|nr:cation transporter dimerization domain-containing protein [Anaerohalosphaeraceae bacterium]